MAHFGITTPQHRVFSLKERTLVLDMCKRELITNPVKVCVRILRHIIIEDNIHSLYVHSTAKQVGGNKHSLWEILELFVAWQPDNKTTLT